MRVKTRNPPKWSCSHFDSFNAIPKGCIARSLAGGLSDRAGCRKQLYKCRAIPTFKHQATRAMALSFQTYPLHYVVRPALQVGCSNPSPKPPSSISQSKPVARLHVVENKERQMQRGILLTWASCKMSSRRASEESYPKLQGSASFWTHVLQNGHHTTR